MHILQVNTGREMKTILIPVVYLILTISIQLVNEALELRKSLISIY